MAFHKFVSMERTPKEKAEKIVEMQMPSTLASIPDVPYGLRISLTEVELEKLGLENDCDVGDLVHLFAMAEVTSVRKENTGDGETCCVELSIISMACEDESGEEEPDEKPSRGRKAA